MITTTDLFIILEGRHHAIKERSKYINALREKCEYNVDMRKTYGDLARDFFSLPIYTKGYDRDYTAHGRTQ
jgi:hypothetical protein